MKTILAFSAVVACAGISSAQTPVPAGNVSGTWTLSGSPYLVQGDISIPSGQTLTVNPGVRVEFQGHYTLFVQGRLLAVGTGTNPITFTVDDTAGFHDPNSPLGGWYGIRFVNTPVQNDTSRLIYCELQYSKALGTDWTKNAGGAVCIVDFDKVLIANCTFSHCSATRSGGGVYLWRSELRIRDTAFRDNWAGNGGALGGLNSTLTLENCLFSRNRAGTNSGAIDYDLDSVLSPACQLRATGSRFVENSAGQYYGAIKVQQPETGLSLVHVFIDRCEFEGNTSARSGAIRLDGNMTGFVISNSSFRRNIAGTQSACAFWRGASGRVSNCLFDSNMTETGLGALLLSNKSNVDFMHCTIVRNMGVTSGALKIQAQSSSRVLNSIFWGNRPDQISLQSQSDTTVSSAYVYHSDIQHGVDSIRLYDTLSVLHWGGGNINAYPLFQDTVSRDYHLRSTSPCIGAGIDTIQIAGTWYYCPSTDIEGNPRPNPAGSMPDVGAYESAYPVGMVEEPPGFPRAYALHQNYPNPFNPVTTISYEIPTQSRVTLALFDVLGREVATLARGVEEPGFRSVRFDAHGLASGVYYYRLKAGDFVATRRLIVLR
ncbi:MAG: right-handed parallel beta-helix repeat-containing protein [Bacteroidota bacterium]